jgi:uncharacterized repeat protein (TIGR03803 family)
MKRNGFLTESRVLTMFTLVLFAAGVASAQEKLLHVFDKNGKDGLNPNAGLIFDASGNLYGTTVSGGVNLFGTVFELSPTAGRTWTEKTLHNFANNGSDGISPYGSLIFDSAGRLYGTTAGGGAAGAGTVFELKRAAGGVWTETLLHSFADDGVDGEEPYGALVFNSAGNLYGTTGGGGVYGTGTVFELTPTRGGWTETVLHSFNYSSNDGYGPASGPIFDAKGNLYGTTDHGGTYGGGTVFELTPAAGGSWTETILYSFGASDSDAANPVAGLIFDATGNLYGTTVDGGSYGYGAVFELMPEEGGSWTEKLLHSFNNNGNDGYSPYASLIFDSAGNLYGTTYQGGAHNDGTVFELMPKAGGIWMEKELHSFDDNGKDGFSPYAGLTFDSTGNLYGTTYQGGLYNFGAVFEITP